MPRARAAQQSAALPLGSLTQAGARGGAACQQCGSNRVTTIEMKLGDGSNVEFSSCHRCDHRAWTEAGQDVAVAGVLGRARKQ